MTTWYRVSHSGFDITAHEIEKETDKFVTVKGTRSDSYRETKVGTWFPTWQLAWGHLLEREMAKLESARRSVEYYEKRIAEVQAMTEDNNEQ